MAQTEPRSHHGPIATDAPAAGNKPAATLLGPRQKGIQFLLRLVSWLHVLRVLVGPQGFWGFRKKRSESNRDSLVHNCRSQEHNQRTKPYDEEGKPKKQSAKKIALLGPFLLIICILHFFLPCSR